MNRDFSLRRWQAEAYAKWCRTHRGLAKVATGAGKTFFSLYCARHYLHSHPSGILVVVVPGVALLEQWVSEVSAFFSVDPKEIVVIAGKRKTTLFGKYYVSTINSLGKLPNCARISQSVIILDECHRYGSKYRSSFLNYNFGARLALSATPSRQYDFIAESVVLPYVGSLFFEYGIKEALVDKVISPFALHNVKFLMSDFEEKKYKKITQNLMKVRSSRNEHFSSDERRELTKFLLVKRSRFVSRLPMRILLACHLAEKYSFTSSIIFHEQIDAVEKICKYLNTRGHLAVPYHSAVGRITRLENLLKFRNGQIPTLVSARALDEGVDIPGASVGIIAASTAATRQRSQRLGRILRPQKGKHIANVYTLYATDEEEKRLIEENDHFSGVVSSFWYQMEVSP